MKLPASVARVLQEFVVAARALTAARAQLDQAAIEALAVIDVAGLELAAESFERKRLCRRSRSRGWRRWLLALMRRA